MLKAKWIGNLTNKHHKYDGDQSRYFGLSYSHCNHYALKAHKQLKPNNFVNVPKNDWLECISRISSKNVTKNTVVVFNWEHVDQSNNFIVFDNVFRNNFHRQRLERKTPKRK